MKKIIITTATLSAGGMERSVVNYASMFSTRGVEVKIFLISSNDISFNLPKNIEVIIGKKNVKNKLLLPYSFLKLRRLAKRYRPDLILSFSGRLSPFVILSLLNLNLDVIPLHRSNPNTTYGNLIGKLNSKLYPKCKALVVQTHEAKSIFKNKYGNKNIIVVPNPVRELNIDRNIKKENVILNVSRLSEGKGLENLIIMFNELDNDEWKLYLVGDGEIRSKLENLINELNLNGKVILLGYQKNVDFYLSIASIFAFTSESEGYPNALLEAMCAGLPSISFDCPTGPNEMIIDGKNGFLIPMGDNEQFKMKLTRLINDDMLRLSFSKEAYKLRDSNSLENIGNTLIEELDKIF